MLVIRLQRTGRENNPTYRLVVSEKARHAKKGTLEILGHFLPSIKEPLFKFEKERVLYWIGKGAKPSDTAARLLKKNGLEKMDGFILSYTKQKPRKEVKAETPAPAVKTEEAAK